jgi:enoyl-CoA hydratase/carnithine racemase
MAGGFELMQAADVVLVRDDARIADNHINFGMIPGGGSTARLPRIVGRQAALAMLLSGERMSGTDAVARGLAYRSFTPADFDTAVEMFLGLLAGRDRGAVTTIKRLVNDGLNQPIGQVLADETDAVVSLIGAQTGQDGVTAFKKREAHT